MSEKYAGNLNSTMPKDVNIDDNEGRIELLKYIQERYRHKRTQLNGEQQMYIEKVIGRLEANITDFFNENWPDYKFLKIWNEGIFSFIFTTEDEIGGEWDMLAHITDPTTDSFNKSDEVFYNFQELMQISESGCQYPIIKFKVDHFYPLETWKATNEHITQCIEDLARKIIALNIPQNAQLPPQTIQDLTIDEHPRHVQNLSKNPHYIYDV
jgi:hypothetical protein